MKRKVPIANCEALDFMEAAQRKALYPLMYYHVKTEGHIQVDRLIAAVAQSSKLVPEILCVYDIRKAAFQNLGHTARDLVITAPDAGKLCRWDISKYPQLRIFIEHGIGQDILTFSMSHVLADGRGFLQYLYLLASLYNGKVKDDSLQNQRCITPLLKTVHVRSATQQSKNARGLSIPPLRPAEKANAFFCLTSRLPASTLSLVLQKTKQAGVTLNDALLASYARTIAKLQKTNHVILPCPADLRSFGAPTKDLSIANMTGTYRIAVELSPGQSFTATAQQIHYEMLLQKSRCRCFSGLSVLNRSFQKLPYFLLDGILRAAYQPSAVSYTNVGIIDQEKLYFQGCPITSCFFTGSYRLPPDFQLTVSTFRGVCTLNCTLIGSDVSKERGQTILERVKRELIAWAV